MPYARAWERRAQANEFRELYTFIAVRAAPQIFTNETIPGDT
jgi:hypothetical protein